VARIKSITDAPRTDASQQWDVLIEDETGPLTKRLWWGGCAQACTPEKDWPEHIKYRLGRLIIEAERDIAYRMFGDEWPRHVSRKHEWPTAWQKRLIDQAIELRPDLFGG
jgi:hypothetical protein